MDAETKLFEHLIELQHGLDVSNEIKELSGSIEWIRGWPSNTESFWNAEAFMWSRKISKEKRALIRSELSSLEGKKNLDVGCGAYSYVRSVGFDISSKMLQFNENLSERVQGNVEKELVFDNGSFESVTAVFVLNYVKNYSLLLKEIYRVLDEDGVFVMILSSNEINEWQRQKVVNNLGQNEWKRELEEAGFNVNFYEKEGLWFFRCGKVTK